MISNLTFSQALTALKNGRSISREGWNGKKIFVYINKGSRDFSLDKLGYIENIPANLFNMGDEGTVTRLPYINMKNASGAIVTGWTPSQTDLLAEDWCALD